MWEFGDSGDRWNNSRKAPLERERERKERLAKERQSREKAGLRSLESICSTDSFGFEGRLNLQPLQTVPVDPAEEGMLPDLPLRVQSSSQTLGRVLGQELGWMQVEKRRRKREARTAMRNLATLKKHGRYSPACRISLAAANLQ